MRKARSLVPFILLFGLLCANCHRKDAESERTPVRKSIVASDTILSGMIEGLLPSEDFEVPSILPPDQCPGHYDVKLSDIAKVKQADLVVSFIGMPYMLLVEVDADKQLMIDSKGRNWMAPDSYIAGMKLLAEELSKRFPDHRKQIALRLDKGCLEVEGMKKILGDRLKRSGVYQKPILASFMLVEPLEWMGFQVVGKYGRPESISAKEVVDLTRVGREKKAYMVADNLQSGPDAGRGIAEALGAPHVVLSNFPMENGYVHTLRDNVDAVLAAMSAQ